MSYKLADGSDSSQYKVGDLFEVVEDDSELGFYAGDTVVLTEDDLTSCPMFEGRAKDGKGWAYANWGDLKPHRTSKKPFTKDDLKDGDIVTVEGVGSVGYSGEWISFKGMFFRDFHKSMGHNEFSSDLKHISARKTYISKVERQGTVVFQREPELIEKTIKATGEQWVKINEILEG